MVAVKGVIYVVGTVSIKALEKPSCFVSMGVNPVEDTLPRVGSVLIFIGKCQKRLVCWHIQSLIDNVK